MFFNMPRTPNSSTRLPDFNKLVRKLVKSLLVVFSRASFGVLHSTILILLTEQNVLPIFLRLEYCTVRFVQFPVTKAPWRSIVSRHCWRRVRFSADFSDCASAVRASITDDRVCWPKDFSHTLSLFTIEEIVETVHPLGKNQSDFGEVGRKQGSCVMGMESICIRRKPVLGRINTDLYKIYNQIFML